MFKRFLPFAGAIAVMVGVLAGCQDSPTTSPDTGNVYAVTGDEAYKAFELDATTLNDFSEVITADEAVGDALVLLPPPPDGDSLRGNPPGRDSLRRGPHPDSLRNDPPDTLRRRHPRIDPPRKDRPNPPRRRDTLNDGRPDSLRHGRPDSTGHLMPINYERIIKQLNLTAGQDSLVRLCFVSYRECSRAADAGYRTARQEGMAAYQTAVVAIRRQFAAGEITREEARAQIDALNTAYRQQVAELERGYRAALESCRSEFTSCVASHLTAEQLPIWERLTRR